MHVGVLGPDGRTGGFGFGLDGAGQTLGDGVVVRSELSMLRRPPADFIALVARVMAQGAGMRSSGSGTLGLVDTALGRLDAYIELHINSWDACGALAIAREAGCWTNDFDSGAWLTEGNPICFAAPALGPRLAALMQG